MIGRPIAGKNRVLRVLGSGGFGMVYLVELTAGIIGQRLALKIVSATLSDDDTVRDE